MCICSSFRRPAKYICLYTHTLGWKPGPANRRVVNYLRDSSVRPDQNVANLRSSNSTSLLFRLASCVSSGVLNRHSTPPGCDKNFHSWAILLSKQAPYVLTTQTNHFYSFCFHRFTESNLVDEEHMDDMNSWNTWHTTCCFTTRTLVDRNYIIGARQVLMHVNVLGPRPT
jgi:hypothetical protein